MVGRIGSLLLTVIAAVLSGALLGRGQRHFMEAFALALPAFLIFSIGLNWYGVQKALKKTPRSPGASLADGVRQAMIAYGSGNARFTAQHPWVMAVIQIVVAAGAAAAVASRWAFYHR